MRTVVVHILVPGSQLNIFADSDSKAKNIQQAFEALDKALVMQSSIQVIGLAYVHYRALQSMGIPVFDTVCGRDDTNPHIISSYRTAEGILLEIQKVEFTVRTRIRPEA